MEHATTAAFAPPSTSPFFAAMAAKGGGSRSSCCGGGCGLPPNNNNNNNNNKTTTTRTTTTLLLSLKRQQQQQRRWRHCGGVFGASFSSILLFLFAIIVVVIIVAVERPSSPSSPSSSSPSSSSSLPSSLFAKAEAAFLDAMVHDVAAVNKSNWDLKIGKFRSSSAFPILFFKNNAESKEVLLGEYNALATFLKGLMTVAAVDCDESPKLCESNGVTKHPSLFVFPVLPFPPYEYKGEMTKAAMLAELSKVVPSKVTSLTTANVEKFLNETPMMPNVVLVSEREHPPFLFRALSNSFSTKMIFGFVAAKTNEGLAKKFKAKKLPHLAVLRKEKKDEVFRGEMTAQRLFEWLNVFSETFVLGGGFSDGVGGAAPPEQPWKYQSIPEMTADSHMDICFRKTDQGLCVVYLRGDGGLDEEEQSMLESVKDAHRSQLLGRGVEFRWSWMNVQREENFRALLQPQQLPSVVVFNPHKRLRFTKKDDEKATKETITQLLEKITGGDARFSNVKGQKLPPFAARSDDGKKAGGAKDEL